MLSTVTELVVSAHDVELYPTRILKYVPLLTEVIEIFDVESHIGTRYIGDLYGLFQFLGIDKTKWLLILRLNNFKSTTDYDGEPVIIYDYSTEALYSAIQLELNLELK